jgi:hypothetical protein
MADTLTLLEAKGEMETLESLFKEYQVVKTSETIYIRKDYGN